MVARARPTVLAMKTAGTQNFIHRIYREGGPLQWVREAYTNATEAGATRVEFGIEWQAVESLGVYRRVIADDGSGMTPDELVEFFNTFGGGGKPIGGEHENFGVGVKTSVLPWNRYGMVVVSWVDGDASMIWVMQDPATGEYGLRLLEAIDPETGESSLDEVYVPYNDPEHGCDWSLVKPDWIGDNGTVVVLLGDEPTQDSVLGDPSREESDIKGISTYLNRRLWEIPEDSTLIVDELRTQDKGTWPRSEEEAHGAAISGPDRRTNARRIEGARYFIEYSAKSFRKGKLAHSGTAALTDGTKIDWYLWEGDRPAVQSYAAISGYIATLYKGELYDVSAHPSTYRSFGIIESEVRRNTWLVIRPPLSDDTGKHGVYPRTDRNALLLRGGPNAGGPLPLHDWAGDFVTNAMPKELLDAIKRARGGSEGTIKDQTWRDRLADRFGARWRIPKLRAHKKGSLTVDPTQLGNMPRKAIRKKRTGSGTGGGTGGTGGGPNIGTAAGTVRAVRAKVAGGLPSYRAVTDDDVGPGVLAAWQANDPDHPEGVVLINVEHPVLAAEIEQYQAQYADVFADQVAEEVIDVYGQVAVAKVAHSEHLKGILPSSVVEEELRSDTALTMSLLGLMGEEALLAPRLGGKFRRKAAAS